MLQPRRLTFSEPQSFSDAASGFVVLTDEYFEVAKALELPDHDGRSSAFRNMAHLAGAAVMILNALDTGSRSGEAVARELFGVESGPIQTAAESLEKFARLAALTLIHFQVENLLANTIRGLGRRPNRQFSVIADQLLNLIGWPAQNRAARVLSISAMLRNTLHNNGIHDGRSFDVQVNGLRFRVQPGGRMRQSGWGHLAHVLRSELRLLERLMNDPSVRRISHVRDQYADMVTT